MKPTDLRFANWGSFVVCMPLTDTGVAWCAESIPDYEGEPFHIDWRCLADIVNGARAAGLICRDEYDEPKEVKNDRISQTIH